MKNFDRMYKDYMYKFNKAKEKAALKGDPIFDETPYTKVEFETMYTGMQNDMRNAGRTVTEKKTIDALIDNQVYSRSLAQGQALQRAAASRGIEMTVHEARVWGGMEDKTNAPFSVKAFWDEIRLAQSNLREQGFSSNEIAKFIAIEFFGSPS